MNLSLQASGNRLNWPSDPAFPWRTAIFEQRADGTWTLSSVFEMSTAEHAEMTALEICTEPYDDGIVAMHYVVGRAA